MTPSAPEGQALRDALFPCPYCGRVLRDQSGRYSHVRAKHGRKAAKPFLPEREPSMAELVVEARLARACGEPVEPWIAEMFDV